MTNGANPSEEHSRRRDRESGDSPAENDRRISEVQRALNSRELISPDILGSLARPQFPQVLDLARLDDGTLKVFRRSIRPLCEEPDDASEDFRNNLCAAVASEIRENCLTNPIAACGPLSRILRVARTVVVALGDNPSQSVPPAFDDLLMVMVDLIDKLSDYRAGSEFAWDDAERSLHLDPKSLMEMWDSLNTASFNLLSRGLQLQGFSPTPQLVDYCADLAHALMIGSGCDQVPRQSKSGVEARAWVHVLRLAATLGTLGSDDAIEVNREALERVAEDLVRWKQGDLIQELTDPKLMKDIFDDVEKCEHYALRALFACKPSEGARSVWNAVVREYPITSIPYRMALLSLAKIELSAARLPLVTVLNALGKGARSAWEQGQHFDTVLQFLAIEGAGAILEGAFDRRHGQPVQNRYMPTVVDLLQERYQRHIEASRRFAEKMRSCGPSNSEQGDSLPLEATREGVIWNRRAKTALEKFCSSFE